MDSPVERAIAAFERLHRLTVTVHDLRGDLAPGLDPRRTMHRHGLCQAVKVHAQHRCAAFELAALRAELARSGAGRCHVCHAGLVEWVVPLLSPRGLDAVLFAGLRRPGPRLGALRDAQPRTPPPWPPGADLPPPVDDAEAADLLEALAALAARIAQLRPSAAPAVAGDGVQRAARIRRFVALRHAQAVGLADLAADLGLSTDRAGREVHRLFGCGLPALLAEARLATAASLLRSSQLSVLEICLQSGFADPSHFHACFRRRFGTTPAAWRLAT